MKDRLKIFGILHKLDLASWEELRKVADDALNKGVYSLSLVDAALDADTNIRDISLAFKKALAELNINVPNSLFQCRWLLLQYYIEQIVNKEVLPYEGLSNIMKVYYSWDFNDPNHPYREDSFNIFDFIGYYWAYDEIYEDLSLTLVAKKKATFEYNSRVRETAKFWLPKH